MDCTPITHCIACGSDALVPVLDLGHQPLANSYKDHENDPEQTFPLAINRCTHCYHVQLTHQVNPELMFKDYAYVSGTAKTQLDYFDWFVDQIVKIKGSTPRTVLDIGCNDGSFLNAWGGTGATTYGVDPAENLYPVSSKNHNVHCGFFTGQEYPGIKFDIITCMNAFAHNANQLELLKHARDRLSNDGLIFCTTSQADMILNGEFDTIYHEHVSFYNIYSAQALCRRAGLNLIDVLKHPIHGTSYIFVISKDMTFSQKVKNLIDEEAKLGLYDPKTYTEYAEKCYKVAELFARTIRLYRDRGIPVVGFGAAAKGNTLLNFANEKPDFIIDENPLKQLKFTPGVAAPIYPLNYLTLNYFEKQPVCFIPLAWNFYDEIVKKVKSVRPAHTHKDIFVRYFPTFEIVE
jgi:2-polyprenyl-3-methyl-5-hydroxy-6-metoxy-1,4-benzoquinol methylase